MVSLFPHPASFRSRLATDTLAFGCILPTTGRIRDFHPLETCAAGRTKKSHNDKCFTYHYGFIRGDSGIRTRDLCVANAALSQLSYIPKYQLPDYYIRAAVLLSSMNLKVIPAKECGHLLGFLRKEGMSRLSCLTLPFTAPELFTLLELCVLLCWEDP